MLELQTHEVSSFVTLTYDDEHLPAGGTLVPKDTQDWLKRFRKANSNLRLRYYLVGEYGDTTERPHYHICLFGYPPCSYGQTRLFKNQRPCCAWCSGLRDTWSRGNVFSAELNELSIQYCAGYVTKKMTSHEDIRLNGRHPEFARMSNRPGIGVPALQYICESIENFNLDSQQADVPSVLQFGKKMMPIGRYLRRKMRVMLGRDPNAPPETYSEINKKMLALQLRSILNPDESVKGLVVRQNASKVASIEARAKIHKKRGSL